MSPDNPLVKGYQYLDRVSQDIPGFEEALSKSPGVHPFDVEDAFDSGSLFNKDELVKYGYFKSAGQKIHSQHQILNPDQIRVGMRLFSYHHEDLSGTFKVTGAVQTDENGCFWFSCVGTINGHPCERLPVVDFGVTQYRDGLYNAWNWLSRKKLPRE